MRLKAQYVEEARKAFENFRSNFYQISDPIFTQISDPIF
jgi:hypothetical protein